MNYMILEGFNLYLFLILVILLGSISLFSLICAILSEKQNFIIGNMLERESKKTRNLLKKILRLS